MMRFSANLGLLFTDRPLPDAIRAAKSAGFDAVECHWPYDVPADDIVTALTETGLPMLGINTHRGDVERGEFGLSALPGREEDAQAAIAQAARYAAAIKAQAVHVLAGIADGPTARDCFLRNLRYATAKAADHGIGIVIEPVNHFDIPGYFLNTTDQALDIIHDVAAPNLSMMFDCYHVGRTEGDVIARLRAVRHVLGHIQFASVPDRGPPDHGAVDYAEVFREIEALGWTKPLAAEYRPVGPTEATLGWMKLFGSDTAGA